MKNCTYEELKAEEILDYCEMMCGKKLEGKKRKEALKEIEFMLTTN